jgi:hypothetical protein
MVSPDVTALPGQLQGFKNPNEINHFLREILQTRQVTEMSKSL